VERIKKMKTLLLSFLFSVNAYADFYGSDISNLPGSITICIDDICETNHSDGFVIEGVPGKKQTDAQKMAAAKAVSEIMSGISGSVNAGASVSVTYHNTVTNKDGSKSETKITVKVGAHAGGDVNP